MFTVKKLDDKPFEKNKIVQMDITLELNLDLLKIYRNSYTILDMLSDIGGINSIFITTFGLIASIWNYRHFDNYMASKLFKIQSADPMAQR